MSSLKLLVLATALPIALGFELPLVPSRVTARACHSPNQRAAELILMKTEASKSEAAELDEGQCFLIDTDEGYVPNPPLSLNPPPAHALRLVPARQAQVRLHRGPR